MTCFFCCDYVVVLEDVHTYIRFVFYEVQKHLVTFQCYTKISNIPFQGCPRPSYTQLTNIVGEIGVAKIKQNFARPLDGPIYPLLHPCIYHLKWHAVTAFVSVPCHYFIYTCIYIYVYNICQFIPLINGLWVYLL